MTQQRVSELYGVWLQSRLDDTYSQHVVVAKCHTSAAGRAMKEGGPGRVAFNKSQSEMTIDERGQWDILTDADTKLLQEQDRERATPWSDLDLY